VLDIVFRALQGLAVVFLVGGLFVIIWQVNRPVKAPPITRLETLPTSVSLPPR
jgi:hypothetical protein